ncbi:MAG: Rieske (2Fe-2S) protein [Pseudomonadales bacterium]|nr:Rieske (2Fe-2S) protein [Pseudomonadales bacterium]
MANKERAVAADYGLGPNEYPRGWFVIAEAKELDAGPMAVTYFGQDFALYRGESGRVVLLDAYCAHMQTHLTASKSAHIVATDAQIEGDSIRCPYHAWRYDADGHVDDIPYHDGPCPKSASLTSYPVREVMGCIMMWFNPEDPSGEPHFEPPYLNMWDHSNAVHWELDHLGEVPIHGIEITDNMADVRHLGPTHGAPCEYFEVEMRDNMVIQRQGGYLELYQAQLDTVTWYTGPGLLLSKQKFGEVTMFEFIANTPVENGVSKCWHGALSLAANNPPTAEDIEGAKGLQAGVLLAFAADFDVWTNKKPATKIMQMKTDGPFRTVRQWIGQFYKNAEDGKVVQQEVNGIHPVLGFPQPTAELKESGFEDDCFKTTDDK